MLLDEFTFLQRERKAIIAQAEREGIHLLKCPEMRTLQLNSVACLEKIMAIENDKFYRDTYAELLAELADDDGNLQ